MYIHTYPFILLAMHEDFLKVPSGCAGVRVVVEIFRTLLAVGSLPTRWKLKKGEDSLIDINPFN